MGRKLVDFCNMKEEEEANLLEEDEKEEKGESRGEAANSSRDRADPVIEAIGEFGRYQLLVCIVGLLINIPHSWVSLR